MVAVDKARQRYRKIKRKYNCDKLPLYTQGVTARDDKFATREATAGTHARTHPSARSWRRMQEAKNNQRGDREEKANNWKEKGGKKKSMTKGSRIKEKDVQTQEHP